MTEEKKKTEAARRKYLGKSLKLETLNEVLRCLRSLISSSGDPEDGGGVLLPAGGGTRDCPGGQAQGGNYTGGGQGGEKGVGEGEREGEITVKQKRMVRASICYSITVLVDVGLLLSLTS